MRRRLPSLTVSPENHAYFLDLKKQGHCLSKIEDMMLNKLRKDGFMAFFNTTNEKGEELEERIEKASTQDELVLKFFRFHKGLSFTPFEVHEHITQGCPITSVRRAITNLTKRGYLVKTALKQEGGYGQKNCKWTAA